MVGHITRMRGRGQISHDGHVMRLPVKLRSDIAVVMFVWVGSRRIMAGVQQRRDRFDRAHLRRRLRIASEHTRRGISLYGKHHNEQHAQH